MSSATAYHIPSATTPGGHIVVIWNFAWPPNSQKYWDSIEREKNSGTPPTPLKRVIWGEQNGPKARFWAEGPFWSFEILHGLLTHKNIRIPMKKKHLGTPLPPLKRVILGEQKGWRRVLKAKGHSAEMFYSPFSVEKSQNWTYWRSSLTGAKSARIGAETKVSGVLKTSGQIWNVGIKICLRWPIYHGDKWGQSWSIFMFLTDLDQKSPRNPEKIPEMTKIVY